MSIRLWVTLPIRLVFAALVAVVIVLPMLVIMIAFASQDDFSDAWGEAVRLLRKVIVPK